MSEDGNYNAVVTGLVQAIYVSKRGIELVVDSENPDSDSSKQSSQVICRLDRSVSHTDNMLQLAQTAFLNKLTVSLLGFGDDRDDTLEFDEIRINSNRKPG